MSDKDYFNSVAFEWDKISKHQVEKINFILEKTKLNTGQSVLDIGSGTGVMIPYIKKRVGKDGKITALDIAENMIKMSQKKNNYENLSFVITDFLDYCSHEKYDCIIAYSCYPHFKNKEQFFMKAYDLLRHNGKLVIAHSEGKDRINNCHRKIEDKISCGNLIDIETMKNYIKKFGFQDIYTKDNEEYYIYIGEKL